MAREVCVTACRWLASPWPGCPLTGNALARKCSAIFFSTTGPAARRTRFREPADSVLSWARFKGRCARCSRQAVPSPGAPPQVTDGTRDRAASRCFLAYALHRQKSVTRGHWRGGGSGSRLFTRYCRRIGAPPSPSLGGPATRRKRVPDVGAHTVSRPRRSGTHPGQDRLLPQPGCPILSRVPGVPID